MPRLVDHAERRAELLAATWRVVRARGVDGTTTRAIAEEAGCSLSALAHCLGVKDDILVAAQTGSHARIRGLLLATLAEARELGELRPEVVDEEVVDGFVVVEGSTLLTLVDGRRDDGRVERLGRIADAFVDGLRPR